MTIERRTGERYGYPGPMLPPAYLDRPDRDFVDYYRGRLRRDRRTAVIASIAWLIGGAGLAAGPWMLIGGAVVCFALVALNLRTVQRSNELLAELRGPSARLLR